MKNKYITYLLRILKVLLHPKILSAITIFMLLIDYVLFKRLGENYEDKYKTVTAIFLIGQIYVITGFSIMLVSKLRNVKWYKSISPLLIFFLISLPVYFRLTLPNKDLRVLSNILDLLSLILLFTAVGLTIKHIIFCILHLRKQKALIFRYNFKLPVRVLIIVAVISVVSFGIYRIYTLENRLQRIENRLGGPEKIGCNEKIQLKKSVSQLSV